MSDLGVDGLIYSASGARGVVNEGLTPAVAMKLAQAFGTWLQREFPGKTLHVVVGYDTRGSGPLLEASVIAGLLATGIHIVRLGICPTPAIIHAQRTNNHAGGVIISGSHNPPQWNGLKCLGPDYTFLGQDALDAIAGYYLHPDQVYLAPWNEIGEIQYYDALPAYKSALFSFLDSDLIKKAGLRVVVDPGGGAGAGVTAAYLRELGANVTVVNGEKLSTHEFPRNLEPTQANLGDLGAAIARVNAHVGFAHDCDADRLAIAGEDGTVYPEDYVLALIVEDTLAELARAGRHAVIVTNVASSMMFDALAEQYGGRVIRTPVGERHLAVTMYGLLPKVGSGEFVFGGEGSCGGVMFPEINNARDGILAALKITEILARKGRPLSELIAALPRFVTARQTLQAAPVKGKAMVRAIGDELEREGRHIDRVDNDSKLVLEDAWVLFHPSNTEPIIRVITEARTREQAEQLCRDYAARLEQKRNLA